MKNHLIVIENGKLQNYPLDNKLLWEIGRPSKENHPDIRMYSATVSRKHGKFVNRDGCWFYVDGYGKNGTVYNGKHIETDPVVLRRYFFLRRWPGSDIQSPDDLGAFFHGQLQ